MTQPQSTGPSDPSDPRWIGNKTTKPYRRILERNDYWKGQMIPTTIAEREDGDCHQMPFDMDWDKQEGEN